jgi:DNA primase
MGLLWRDGGETMAGRVVIPELRGGQCIWMVGRTLDDARQPKYRGLSMPKPILGYERVRGRPRVFVTEGAFDYLTGMSWGLSICALLGTQVRAERLAFLQRARRVLIAFDSDEPGREAASDLARRLGSRARILELPEGVKDLNDLGRRPDGRAAFFRLIRETEHGGSELREADEDVAEAQ